MCTGSIRATDRSARDVTRFSLDACLSTATAYGCVSPRAGFLFSRGVAKGGGRGRAPRRDKPGRDCRRGAAAAGKKSEARRDGLARANHLVCIHLQGILYPAISPRAVFSPRFLPPRNPDWRVIHLDEEENGSGEVIPREKEEEGGRQEEEKDSAVSQ